MRLFTLDEDKVASSVRDWVSEAGVVNTWLSIRIEDSMIQRVWIGENNGNPLAR